MNTSVISLLFSFLFLALQAGTARAASRCEDLFFEPEIAAQEESLGRVRLQHFYENLISFMQKKVTVASIRGTDAKIQENKNSLNRYLKDGVTTEAIDLYRRNFEDVELSYFIIQQSTKQLESLSPESNLRSTLEKRLVRAQKKFAANYGEYTSTRKYLESFSTNASAADLTRQTAASVLKYLGTHKFSEIYPDYAALKIPEQRISLDDVKNLFRSKSDYIRYKLIADFREEIQIALKYVLTAEVFVQAVDQIINKFPASAADRLKAVLGLMRSAQLRARQLPQLVEIMSLPEKGTSRLEELRRKNSRFANDELLVTFVRTVDFSNEWIELKKQAKAKAEDSTESAIYKNFYERMNDSEKRVEKAKLSDISIYEKVSNIDVIFTLIQTGLIIKTVGPDVFHTTTEFWNFVLANYLNMPF